MTSLDLTGIFVGPEKVCISIYAVESLSPAYFKRFVFSFYVNHRGPIGTTNSALDCVADSRTDSVVDSVTDSVLENVVDTVVR